MEKREPLTAGYVKACTICALLVFPIVDRDAEYPREFSMVVLVDIEYIHHS